MGSRLDGFDVDLEFGPDGGVDKVYYRDSEGCGHAHELLFTDTVDELVNYHLNHYRRNHDMAPQPWCAHRLELADGSELRCVKDPQFLHDEHVFTWRGR